MRRMLLGLLTLLIAESGYASELKLGGNWHYSFDFDARTVQISGDNIANNSASTSDKLKLRVYLTDSPYDGSHISGWVIFEQDYNPLSSGYWYQNVNLSGGFRCSPPERPYYVTCVLCELSGDTYYIVDAVSFDGALLFKAPGGQPQQPTFAPSPNLYDPVPPRRTIDQAYLMMLRNDLASANRDLDFAKQQYDWDVAHQTGVVMGQMLLNQARQRVRDCTQRLNDYLAQF